MEKHQKIDKASDEQIAEKIGRDAESRKTFGSENRKPDRADLPPRDNPAPFSSALGLPTLLNESKTEPEDEMKKDSPSKESDEGFLSSNLGLPLLSENPTPLSSVLHIPTLIDESKSES